MYFNLQYTRIFQIYLIKIPYKLLDKYFYFFIRLCLLLFIYFNQYTQTFKNLTNLSLQQKSEIFIKNTSSRKMQIQHQRLQTSSALRVYPKKAPIDIVFNNLTYTIQVENQKSSVFNKLDPIKKHILNGITGIIPHGQVTAIMGASGAGKTSLLNILACRIDKTQHIYIEGEVLANKKPYDFNNFGDFANYVMQNDILMQTLTVKQTLQFAAELKLNVSKIQRDQTIQKLVEDLKLQKCIDVVVGGSLIKGISGGQRKRTSLAFQLISDPQVLFLDEPTSGLDSLTAYVIVSYMKKLTKNKNKTVAMSIHQPSSQIYALFDNLILMVGGKIIYQGDKSEAIHYFEKMGFKSPEFTNPPDYFMSIMHHESKQNVQNYQLYFSNYEKLIAPNILKFIESSESDDYQKRLIETSAWVHLCTLLNRDLINVKRNPMILKSRIIQSVILALICGGLFWDLSSDYTLQGLSQGFNSKNGALFFLVTTHFMGSLSPVMLTFPSQRAVFLKQQSSKMYTVTSYFLSRNIVQIPYLIIVPLIMSFIMYWMLSLANTVHQFFIFFFISFISNLSGSSVGLLVGSSSSDTKVVAGLVPLIILPLMLFSGFYKNTGDLPVWLGWIQYLSPIKYGFIAYAQNQFKNTNAPLYLLNFDLDMWGAIGVMIALCIVSRLISLLTLWGLRSKLQ